MYWLDLKSHRLHYASISWRLACTRLRRDVKEERAARLLTLICGCRLQGWRRSSRPLKRTVSHLYLQNKSICNYSFPHHVPFPIGEMYFVHGAWRTSRHRSRVNSLSVKIWTKSQLQVWFAGSSRALDHTRIRPDCKTETHTQKKGKSWLLYQADLL